jgi:hypothetical protein
LLCAAIWVCSPRNTMRGTHIGLINAALSFQLGASVRLHDLQ